MNRNVLAIDNGSLNPTPKVRRGTPVAPQHKTHAAGSFAEVLKNQQRGMEVKLSAHAQERLRQQNITISPQDISRISEATKKAEMKGSKESLILLRDLALVVSVNNRTVITAIDRARQKERVFTNIDSTIIL